MMEGIHPLRSEEDYDLALAEIEAYFKNAPQPKTSAADRFNFLAAAIEEYEARHWPINPADPVGAIG